MKIYTKQGDRGDTRLVGGSRIKKSAQRVNAYGDVDELNAVLGCALAYSDIPEISKFLRKIQATLFELGAVLANPNHSKQKSTGILESDVQSLETFMDELSARLPPLKTFILPGGNTLAAQLHLARTVCRRAERECVRLIDAITLQETTQETTEQSAPFEVQLKFLNRLSDTLFVAARYACVQSGAEETLWYPRKKDED